MTFLVQFILYGVGLGRLFFWRLNDEKTYTDYGMLLVGLLDLHE